MFSYSVIHLKWESFYSRNKNQVQWYFLKKEWRLIRRCLWSSFRLRKELRTVFNDFVCDSCLFTTRTAEDCQVNITSLKARKSCSYSNPKASTLYPPAHQGYRAGQRMLTRTQVLRSGNWHVTSTSWIYTNYLLFCTKTEMPWLRALTRWWDNQLPILELQIAQFYKAFPSPISLRLLWVMLWPLINVMVELCCDETKELLKENRSCSKWQSKGCTKWPVCGTGIYFIIIINRPRKQSVRERRRETERKVHALFIHCYYLVL